MNRFVSAALLVVLVAVSGCDKKSSNPTNSSGNTPTIPAVNIKTSIPDTTTNPYALEAKGQVALINALFTPISIFGSLPGTNSGNTWTWTCSYGGLTETFTAVKQGDGSYTWTWTLNGTDGTHTYTNWVFWQGTSNAAGTGGSWSIYSYADTTYTTFVWSTDGTGVVTGTLQDMEGSTVVSKLVLTSNPDKSGEIDFYEPATVLTQKWVWLATGHGFYYHYPSPGGSTPAGAW